jgi:Predicted periplasmic lipoprotein (DUF2279)
MSHTGANRRTLLAIAEIMCLTAVSAPVGMLRPMGAVAQPISASEASPESRRKARSQASGPLQISQQEPARVENEAFAPVPPPFDPGDQFSNHLQSVGWELAVVGGALVAVGVRDWDWGGSKFAFINEGWFGSNTRHGGMDKIGHTFSTYVIADILTDRIRANASNPAGAQFTGALLAFGIMGAGETIDGFTGKHRFSREDIAANAIGAAFSVFRNSIPGLREKLDFRFMYTPASYEKFGIAPSEFNFIPPYERQRYIMALKGSGFDALKDSPLRYFELQGGFDARGFGDKERQLGYPVERTFYAGIGLNLNEILFAAGSFPNLARYRDTPPAWAVRKAFEYIQVPYTAAYYGNTTVRAPANRSRRLRR